MSTPTKTAFPQLNPRGIRPGQRIRAYDYSPELTALPVYAEGEVLRHVSSPLEGIEIRCDTCTHYGREGTRFVVPYDKITADFPGRITLIIP